MARRVPKCPAPPAVGTHAGRTTVRSYSIHVVTPLFGGGVEPGKNDPVTLIRGSSIRGQLRFWWRASRGAAYSNRDELRKGEGKIWGTAESPSPVAIRVVNARGGKEARWAEFQPDGRGGVRPFPKPVDPAFPGYALFPFQGKTKIVGNGTRQPAEQPATVTWTAEFELTIQWPTDLGIDKDVEAAVWAWVVFGGLGARTRRGCGALYCDALSPRDPNNLAQWYQERLNGFAVTLPDRPLEWPTLPRKILIKLDNGKLTQPARAWSLAIGILNKFRQGAGSGRNPGREPNRPGRSRWPEADSIRRITSKAAAGHHGSITSDQDAFPRAELGLPIIFHFKDEKYGEPGDHQLLPKGESGRMASPLIMKPLAFREDASAAMVARLVTKPLAEVQLKGGDQTRAFGGSAIRRSDLANYNNSPMKNRSTSGSALEAFMNFAEQEGFR